MLRLIVYLVDRIERAACTPRSTSVFMTCGRISDTHDSSRSPEFPTISSQGPRKVPILFLFLMGWTFGKLQFRSFQFLLGWS